MSRIWDHLVAGLIAAALTGAVAGVVIWQIAASERAFVVRQFDAQSAKIQNVGDELAKSAGDLKRLDGALKTTEATLREVKDRVALAGTRTGMAQLNDLAEAANKTLAEIKQATAPERTKTAIAPLDAKLDTATAALAPLAGKLDSANKTLAALQTRLDDTSGDKARDESLARIETTLAGVKDALAKLAPDAALTQANAKLDEALKSLAAIGRTTDALKNRSADTAKLDEASKSLTAIEESLAAIERRAGAGAEKLEAATKSIAALDASVKQGFADVASKQADVMTAVAKPAPVPQPAAPKQDLVVFYVSMGGQAAAKPATAAPATTAATGLTPPAPPPLAVRYEEIGGVDDEGQAKAIAGRLREIVKGHSGCTVSVAGHADTLGSDRDNYELSKARAEKIVGKLKTAFAGSGIAVSQTQWGERQLKEWTPDGTARQANRRVDIKVSCEN